MKCYDEVIDFIASGPSPGEVASFRPSDAVNKRAELLVQREKSGELTDDEKSELDHYLELEHIMRLAKARARPLQRTISTVAGYWRKTASSCC